MNITVVWLHLFLEKAHMYTVQTYPVTDVCFNKTHLSMFFVLNIYWKIFFSKIQKWKMAKTKHVKLLGRQAPSLVYSPGSSLI